MSETLSYTSAVEDLRSQAEAGGIKVLSEHDIIGLRGQAKQLAGSATKLGLQLAERLQITQSKGSSASCIWRSPDEWLVLLNRGEGTDWLAQAETAWGQQHVALVDLSGNYTILQLQRDDWRNLLSQLCYYDFALANFPVGKAISTSFDHTSAIIAHQHSEQPLVILRNSYAHYLLSYMLSL